MLPIHNLLDSGKRVTKDKGKVIVIHRSMSIKIILVALNDFPDVINSHMVTTTSVLKEVILHEDRIPTNVELQWNYSLRSCGTSYLTNMLIICSHTREVYTSVRKTLEMCTQQHENRKY